MAMMPGQTGNAEQDRLLMEYLVTMGGMQPEAEDIARQRKTVDMLRDQSQMPQMRGNSRVQTAANPLEFLGSIAGQGAAAYRENDANVRSAALRKMRNEELGKFAQRAGFGGAGAPMAANAGPEQDIFSGGARLGAGSAPALGTPALAARGAWGFGKPGNPLADEIPLGA